jgi:hypothetical protein
MPTENSESAVKNPLFVEAASRMLGNYGQNVRKVAAFVLPAMTRLTSRHVSAHFRKPCFSKAQRPNF